MKISSSMIAVALVLFTARAQAAPPAAGGNPYAAWKQGPSAERSFFPLAVWLQDPANAERYKAAGINVYVGLWMGPTEEQLGALKAAGMRVVCSQNETGLKHLNDPTIVAWMHGDEPDNAQSLGEGKGYGPPILPEKIIADYERIRAADLSRPVLLNLGQAVAWDNYIGRGVRRNHPEDYPEYAKGGDIVSFDIYPVTSPYPEIRGNLWYVPRGVERLRGWAGPGKIVWNCIECTRISSDRKATPGQVRAEVWMSLIHGSKGIIYFVHEWKPAFNEHALLDDPEMLAEVTRLNGQIQKLAPVLNTPEASGAVEVKSSNPDVPVVCTARRLGKDTYIFAVGMRDGATTARFRAEGLPAKAAAEVIDEGRTIEVRNGAFEDAFGPWGVHLYRISPKR
jgi:hypothetical protein